MYLLTLGNLLDESSSDNDAGSEVTSEEVDKERNSQLLGSGRDDREESDGRRNDQDDEESGDASTEPAVVFVLTSVHVANDIPLVGCVEVNVVGIECRILARHQGCDRHDLECLSM